MTSTGANAATFALASTCRGVNMSVCQRMNNGQIGGGPWINVSLWRCKFLCPTSPEWNQDISSREHRGWRRLRSAWGKGAMLLKEPFVAISPAPPTFSESQRWHWRRPGMQENPQTCLTCRPLQSPHEQPFAISYLFLHKGTNLLFTDPRGCLMTSRCGLANSLGYTQVLDKHRHYT